MFVVIRNKGSSTRRQRSTTIEWMSEFTSFSSSALQQIFTNDFIMKCRVDFSSVVVFLHFQGLATCKHCITEWFWLQTASNGVSKSVLLYEPTIEDDGRYLTCRAENAALRNTALEDQWTIQVHCKQVLHPLCVPFIWLAKDLRWWC